jgi:hypothetical protein
LAILIKPTEASRGLGGCHELSQTLEIVRLQGFRGQFRITIPREMVEKLRWQKGQPLFISLEGTRVVVEPVTRK